MKISKTAVLALGGVFMAAGLGLMFVSADEAVKHLKIDMDNAVQHFYNVRFISSGATDSVVDMTRVGGEDPLIRIDANNFVITQTGSAERNVISAGYRNSILGGIKNVIGGSSDNVILGGSGNKTASQSDVILGGVSNIVAGSYSDILGGSGNKTNNHYAVIIGGSDNEVTSQYSVAVGKNIHVLKKGTSNVGNSIALGSNATVEADKSFLWSDGTSVTLGVDNLFAVKGASGMVVNANAAHSFAKLTIGGSLVITNKNQALACNPAMKGILKLKKESGKTCFCSCDGSAWNSVIGGGVCMGICNDDRSKAKCNYGADLNISCNVGDNGSYVYTVENGCERGNIVEGTGGLLVDEGNKMHWTCLEANGDSTGCVSPFEVQTCDVVIPTVACDTSNSNPYHCVLGTTPLDGVDIEVLNTGEDASKYWWTCKYGASSEDCERAKCNRTVTFKINGGSFVDGTTADITEYVSCGGNVELKSIQNRMGYTFDGWYTAQIGGSKVGWAGENYGPINSNLTLYAHWLSCTNTLNVNPNGGKVTFNGVEISASTGVTRTCSGTIVLPVPSKTSTTTADCTVTFSGAGGTPTALSKTSTISKTTTYPFSGWTNAGTCGGWDATTHVYTFAGTNGVTCTKTAQWKTATTTTTTTGKVILPGATRTNYTFDGWYTAKTGGTRIGGSGDQITPTSCSMLYAHWTINSCTNTLNVNPNGGKVTFNGVEISAQTGVTKNCNSTIVLPVPSKTSTTTANCTVTFSGAGGTPTALSKTSTISKTTTYPFNGWTNAGTCGGWDATTHVYTFAGTNGVTCTKTAQWKTATTTTTTGKVILPGATRTNYTFDGWYTAETGGTRIGGSGDQITPTSCSMLYAHWLSCTNTLNVNPNGGKVTFNGVEISAQTGVIKNCNSTIVLPVPSKTSTTTADCTVTFSGAGGTPTALSKTSTISKTTTYPFSGWTNAGTCGGWDAITHVYTFAGTNGVTCTKTAQWKIATTTTTTGKVILPGASRGGYTFDGWYTAKTGGTRIGGSGDQITPTSCSMLYAHWLSCTNTLNVNPNGGKVTFNGVEISAQTGVTKNCNSTIVLPVPSKTSTTTADCTVTFSGAGGTPTALSKTSTISKTTTYPFSGWTNAGTCGGWEPTTYTFPGTNGVTCTKTAQWKTATTTTTTGKVILPGASRGGYTFDGWYTAKTGGTRIGGSGDQITPTSCSMLYAHWTINSCTNTLNVNPNGGKVTFNGVEISAQTGVTKNCNSTIVLPVPSKTSTTTTNCTVTFSGAGGTPTALSKTSTVLKTTTYPFSGWTNAGTCGGWEPTTYTFPGTNGVTCTKTAQWKNSITIPTTGKIILPGASRGGYTFDGWYTAKIGGTRIGGSGDQITPTSCSMLYARWTQLSTDCAITVENKYKCIASDGAYVDGTSTGYENSEYMWFCGSKKCGICDDNTVPETMHAGACVKDTYKRTCLGNCLPNRNPEGVLCRGLYKSFCERTSGCIWDGYGCHGGIDANTKYNCLDKSKLKCTGNCSWKTMEAQCIKDLPECSGSKVSEMPVDCRVEDSKCGGSIPNCTSIDPDPIVMPDPELPECGTSKYSCNGGSVYSGIENGLMLNTWICRNDSHDEVGCYYKCSSNGGTLPTTSCPTHYEYNQSDGKCHLNLRYCVRRLICGQDLQLGELGCTYESQQDGPQNKDSYASCFGDTSYAVYGRAYYMMPSLLTDFDIWNFHNEIAGFGPVYLLDQYEPAQNAYISCYKGINIAGFPANTCGGALQHYTDVPYDRGYYMTTCRNHPEYDVIDPCVSGGSNGTTTCTINQYGTLSSEWENLQKRPILDPLDPLDP